MFDLAAQNYFVLQESEAGEYARLADELLGVLDGLEEPRTGSALEAHREAGEKPSEAEDPLNAIARSCDVYANTEGILSGKRIALKDSISIADIPLTCGSRALQGFVPRFDSVLTERILRAGGRIVAVTNMDDFAFSGSGDTSVYGPTLNPFDTCRTAGGSSSGSAASLHYDGIDMAVGTDQGGSIRLPSAWCGVIGLKPTHGLIPYTGIVAIDQTVDHAGPMARSAAELALLLQAIAGYDASDPRQREPSSQPDYLGAAARPGDDLAGIRIGVVQEAFGPERDAEAETLSAVRTVVDSMRDHGATIIERSLPEHLLAGPVAFGGAFEGLSALFMGGGNGYHWKGEYWPELAEALGPGLRAFAQDLAPQVKVALMLGTYLRERYFGAIYANAQNRRPVLARAYDRALDGVDLLLMPTSLTRARLIDASLPLSERVLQGWSVLANTTPTDLTGHPAISLPLAEASGLPVGVMVIGRHWSEPVLINFAATCEQLMGWRPSPKETSNAIQNLR